MIEREFMPLMPENTIPIMYAIFIIAMFVFFHGIKRILSSFEIGYRDLVKCVFETIKAKPKEVARNFFKFIVLQTKTQESSSARLLHSPIFFAFLMLIAGTTVVAIDEDVIGKIVDFKLLTGYFYLVFEILMDTAGLGFLFGLTLVIVRRCVSKPKFLHTKKEDYWVICMLFIILVSGYFVEALRLKLSPTTYNEYSYVANFLNLTLLGNPGGWAGIKIYRFLWYFHFISAMVFIAVMPRCKLKHLFIIPLSLIIYPPKTYEGKAKLSTPFNILEMDENDPDGGENLDKIGVGDIGSLKWNERLQISACINCGRCENVCPANNSGRLLSPRNVIQKLGNEISIKNISGDIFENVISHEEMWGCTNCYACTEVCPSFISHVDYFINFRRHIVNEGFEDESKISILGNIDRNGNPYGLPSYERSQWLEDMNVPKIADKENVEYLYFIGCSSSYDQRCQEITKAVIAILDHAGVDYGILMEEERCCGEPAKRMGEEGLFQMTAIQNIEMFESYGAKNIIVHCPHCYNMLKHEYKEFNGNYKVIHHSDLIADLIQNKKLKLSRSDSLSDIIFHDPCNLGRLNGIFEAPRNILRKFGNLKEMKRARADSFCCGGGGGNAFYKVDEGKRISQIRLEEALELNPSLIASACPFCMIMFEDVKGGLASNDYCPQVLDIAEIVHKQMVK